MIWTTNHWEFSLTRRWNEAISCPGSYDLYQDAQRNVFFLIFDSRFSSERQYSHSLGFPTVWKSTVRIVSCCLGLAMSYRPDPLLFRISLSWQSSLATQLMNPFKHAVGITIKAWFSPLATDIPPVQVHPVDTKPSAPSETHCRRRRSGNVLLDKALGTLPAVAPSPQPCALRRDTKTLQGPGEQRRGESWPADRSPPCPLRWRPPAPEPLKKPHQNIVGEDWLPTEDKWNARRLQPG